MKQTRIPPVWNGPAPLALLQVELDPDLWKSTVLYSLSGDSFWQNVKVLPLQPVPVKGEVPAMGLPHGRIVFNSATFFFQ